MALLSSHLDTGMTVLRDTQFALEWKKLLGVSRTVY